MGARLGMSVHGIGRRGRQLGVGVLGLAALLIAGLIMTTVGASEGPAQQIIIMWRDAPTAAEQKTWMANTLREAGARQGVSLRFVRTMGTGASVYKISPPLAQRELDALIKTLAGDPHVAYAEPDSMMRTMPRR